MFSLFILHLYCIINSTFFRAIVINCTVLYKMIKVIDVEHSTDHQLNLFNLSSIKTDSAIIILAENILTIDKILLKFSQYLPKIRRQKIILMVLVTKANDNEFCAQADDLLTKFWEHIRIINIILITPCSTSPKVCNFH